MRLELLGCVLSVALISCSVLADACAAESADAELTNSTLDRDGDPIEPEVGVEVPHECHGEPSADAVSVVGRPLLPSHVWPLTLGRERARQIVQAALEGHQTLVIPADEPVYYGGGIVMRPKDALHTSITINWRMIQEELAAADVADREAGVVDDPVTALVQRVAELERQLAAVQRELQAVRLELDAQVRAKFAAMTPEEAVESFKQDPQKLLTVEFGVESAGWPDGPIPIGEDQMPPIMADWDGKLSNGGRFTLYLKANAIRGLDDVGIELPQVQPLGLNDFERLGVLCKHLKGKGVRVTGLVKANRPGEAHTDYSIEVDDPANFRINK